MKCPASVDGVCQLVIAMGARCDGYSSSCRMRPAVERQQQLAGSIEATVRKAFGIDPRGGE